MVSAGELSGDLHGSLLVKELRRQASGLTFFGIGSKRLALAGVDIRLDISPRSSVGIFEALPNLFSIYRSFRKAKALILSERPDLVILIDSQGFNLPLARFCKKVGIKTVYYIAPQEWLWGSDKGTKSVLGSVDLVIAIFQKEFTKFRAFGNNVVYYGHPLIDIVHSSGSKVSLLEKFGLSSSSGPIVALCPGSRAHEIRSLVPIFSETARLIKRSIPGTSFILPLSSPLYLKTVEEAFAGLNCKIIIDDTYNALSVCDLAICASGTINLEAALLSIPNIMAYKLSPLTFLVGKYLLNIDRKIKYFCMINLLLDKLVVPELVMSNLSPLNLSRSAVSLLRQPNDKMLASFSQLKGELGSPGVIPNVARAILNRF
ncbi:lipid-A-disaccharide synthase [candidate division WOR-1 bacterium RIFOXYA12_FULL_52_29]|uniref:Lipid-A-disaccharide synthase n=1 Tax=candidate division WOR-1 bacterium RIFOXYC12_FULL_54_18 TaxID=1802584 RepID=A0A1F4T6T9_UNCSA|nr:MAG: lipid-A-disaccharide synthase [candidate division WOR-1 bacterium RIFOXYA2_FULL_51_19]OGC18021.1 MAG: lipid-A-disaccharide synthase [candidate division WOR-1 bacterium RIFOXYA12_FULL_52_29]OGC26877.1 MAG: lipid-A-disaccharide synthase [candidate division WOR-1 bacterium RIFOXYB2_FULL_45_9]OGC28438.1 MAG: lipid-A-disaccharide synthase [candidate division WOR-1 bacterium RIFOXYC12_FULL_54_18]OGC31107.1 MAG: lipid-A-disaccharide synthase [candidate division WOR-1 bacterium RIFOXYB12_FULL_5